MRAVIVLSVLLLAGSACSVRSGGGGGSSLTAQVATCNAVIVAHDILSDPKTRGGPASFASIVAQDRPSTLTEGVSSAVALGLRDEDYGPYGPALRYLAQRVSARSKEFAGEVAMPKRTAAVVVSAKRLDRDLADGMCPMR